jgi:hypothetical protein
MQANVGPGEYAAAVLNRAFAYTTADDRYLLLGFDWGTKRFKFRVLVA